MPPRKRPASTQNDAPESDNESAHSTDGDSTANQSHCIATLVRLALASEVSRTPIRRADITQHVLAPHAASSKAFKPTFAGAQLALRQVFGMDFTELPAREKFGLAAKRKEAAAAAAAQQANKARSRRGGPAAAAAAGADEGDDTPSSTQAQAQGGASSAANSQKTWITTSVLPPALREALCAHGIGPSKAPDELSEAQYIGLCTFAVAAIVLAGGVLAQGKFDRQLRRAAAEQETPLGTTEKVLGNMVKQGYIVRVKENSGGEEVVEYYVGPRGKAEIGEKGVQGLVRAIYGENGGPDLERRLERSLKVSGMRPAPGPRGADAEEGRRVRARLDGQEDDDNAD